MQALCSQSTLPSDVTAGAQAYGEQCLYVLALASTPVTSSALSTSELKCNEICSSVDTRTSGTFVCIFRPPRLSELSDARVALCRGRVRRCGA
ncbi:hypothetical protein PsorP6_012105 [Peronosclerospora sorghi]|uniref:Uncharacterized protein n=1 Tax=Peronosclerospora sorghi TaxID=230839 RepID=A0ACC0WK50_9STRA|nr:hypothetical protein PsorP6_012105 [Peronosclerospora sorghi]